MWTIFFLTPLALAQPEVKPPPEIVDQIENTRASISQDERQQREALSHLFLINKNVKDITHKQAQLNDHLLSLEAQIRAAAQEVGALEERSEKQKGMLNKRLRQLYQERKQDDFHWLFSAQSPVELERNHRFLRRMIDSDHRQLKVYISNLTALQKKRSQLKGMVAHFAGLQKAIQAQETQLSQQLREKSKFLEELRKSKEFKLTQLKGLRQENGALDNLLSYAFFERKGVLHPSMEPMWIRNFVFT
jgi:septal ring factor EnvC (AmiA/AmiB activator)